MILQRCSSEEVYDGRLAGIFVWLYVEVSFYVDLYNNVDVEDEHNSGF